MDVCHTTFQIKRKEFSSYDFWQYVISKFNTEQNFVDYMRQRAGPGSRVRWKTGDLLVGPP